MMSSKATDKLELDYSTLNEMIGEIEGAPPLYRPSPFWTKLTKQAIHELEMGGLENFKRTVNMKYFNWNALTIVAHQMHPMLGHWLKDVQFDILKSEFKFKLSNLHKTGTPYKTFNPFSAFIYKSYLTLLFNYVKSIDALNLLEQLEEPQLGNPYLVKYRNKMISQDLCNSVHEFYSSTEGITNKAEVLNVMELGAGYGRLAYVFLKALPRCKYTIIDIPVALFVAQEYLSRVFPSEKIFKFRHFESYAEIKEEFEASRIRFLSANQIEMLPNKQADLFVNISSLHEMTMEQIRHFLAEIDRLCKGSFYSKQWRRSIAKENGFVIRQFDYPTPKNWSLVYNRQHPIQRLFFEASYRL